MPRTMRPGNAVNPPVSGEDRLEIMPGYTYGYLEDTRTISTAIAAYDIGSVPIGARIVSAQLKLTGVTAATAVKIGIGRKESTADPDKYLLTSALTSGQYGGVLNTIITADTAAVETIQVTACDTSGVAAGTITGGTVSSRVVFRYAENL